MAQPFVEPCNRGIIEAEPCPRELGREISPPRRRIVLAGCVLASSMAFIDGSALTVALPRLRAALEADLASVQWVLNGYVLTLASLTLVGGALADAYGKARMHPRARRRNCTGRRCRNGGDGADDLGRLGASVHGVVSHFC